jgi:hypothetical protein
VYVCLKRHFLIPASCVYAYEALSPDGQVVVPTA